MDDGKWEGLTNSKTPERVLELVTSWAKETYSNAIVIGQVNKAGKMAGTQKLKHMVDAMIELSIEEKDEDLKGCRVLQTTKNRFGGAGHQIWLDLKKEGFKEVARLGV